MKTFTMLPEDIQQASKSASDCPIARCLSRYGVRQPIVSFRHTFFDNATGQRRMINTPGRCQDFIRAFDNGKEVAPLTFELPDEVLS